MSSDLFDLTGRVALVTGSSRGLGRVIAGGLARAGATVCLNGRDEARLAGAVAAFRDAGLEAHGAAFDVTDVEQTRAGVAALEAAAGCVDILVNNAGINLRAPLEDVALDTWRQVLDTNLTGVLVAAQAVVGGMIRRGERLLVNAQVYEIASARLAGSVAVRGKPDDVSTLIDELEVDHA